MYANAQANAPQDRLVTLFNAYEIDLSKEITTLPVKSGSYASITALHLGPEWGEYDVLVGDHGNRVMIGTSQNGVFRFSADIPYVKSLHQYGTMSRLFQRFARHDRSVGYPCIFRDNGSDLHIRPHFPPWATQTAYNMPKLYMVIEHVNVIRDVAGASIPLYA